MTKAMGKDVRIAAVGCLHGPVGAASGPAASSGRRCRRRLRQRPGGSVAHPPLPAPCSTTKSWACPRARPMRTC